MEPGTTLSMLRRRHFPASDVTVLNGFPMDDDQVLTEGDRVVFITRDIAESTIRKVFASFFEAEKKGWSGEQQQQQQ